jgi:hypothetical protein
VHVTTGCSVEVKLSRKILYELDGGDREEKKMRFRVTSNRARSPHAFPAAM